MSYKIKCDTGDICDFIIDLSMPSPQVRAMSGVRRGYELGSFT